GSVMKHTYAVWQPWGSEDDCGQHTRGSAAKTPATRDHTCTSIRGYGGLCGSAHGLPHAFAYGAGGGPGGADHVPVLGGDRHRTDAQDRQEKDRAQEPQGNRSTQTV